MLSQEEADALIDMPKKLEASVQEVKFPLPGSTVTTPVISSDGRVRFQLDLERGGKVNRWKLQLRHRETTILVRLEIGGPGHHNPKNAPNENLADYEDQLIPTPHIQRYVEGFEDAWATPLPPQFLNPNDVAVTWQQFLSYCNITWAPLQGAL